MQEQWPTFCIADKAGYSEYFYAIQLQAMDSAACRQPGIDNVIYQNGMPACRRPTYIACLP